MIASLTHSARHQSSIPYFYDTAGTSNVDVRLLFTFSMVPPTGFEPAHLLIENQVPSASWLRRHNLVSRENYDISTWRLKVSYSASELPTLNENL
jgi:hypothetical protein